MRARDRIMIVDDDDGMLDYLSMILEEAGFRVTTAQDPDQGFIQAEALRPALIIVDLRFASINSGAVLLRRLRSAYRLRPMPIIVLTAMDPVKALGMIPSDPRIQVMFKPPDRERFLETIRALLTIVPDMQ